MNCQLCREGLNAYREGNMAPGMKNQIKSHLETCKECSEIFRLEILTDRVIDYEKKMQVNPFLSTRVMAQIEDEETAGARQTRQILRPALIALSMAAAVFLGVTMGNISAGRTNGKVIPVELALIDDAGLESLDLLSNE